MASNRLVVIEHKPRPEDSIRTPVRYLEDNKIELYKKFPLKDQVKKATFHRYLIKSKIFKKPHRLTDLCEYCEKLRSIKPDVESGLEKFGYNRPETGINIEDAKKILIDKRKQLILQNQNLTEVIFNSFVL